MSKLDFAALLCSRLCHDLVSPVGAINNGLEILADEKDPSMRAAVVDLIEKSTRQTSNKLQFFRLAFGAAGGFSAQLDVRECEKAIGAILDGSRVSLDWRVPSISVSKNQVKVLLNLALLVAESMIRGGMITVTVADNDGMSVIRVRGEGERVIMQDEVKAALAGKLDEDDLEPRAAPAYLAHAVATEAGGNTTVAEIDDKTVELVAKLPIT
ncbi:histidine phosphotransferase family protein [Kordiimonas aestuarii]|uniref:histidine phosphotransferase family protein n=1 Tax=Kordiimonas aestuarii TaxID=1005925 RepID=UPI0021D0A792|nr:histidine phosphotransferase family protein [Kordiimonas aestuarii]